MRIGLAIIFSYLLGPLATAAQEQMPVSRPEYGPNDTIVVYATLMPDGTLVPTSVLPDVEIIGRMPRWMAKERKQWTRLRNAVYVTYPYAMEAGRVINEINQQLANAQSESTRREIIKAREKDLKKNFADKLMNLSVYQGRVLMKLINRETGNNCYDILKEYKGGANARMWQTVAFFFGSNLKQTYHATGEDAEIETIVQEVKRMYFKG
ncbi:MAG TPA: DUF4294 domain-containing protein [Phnomibacter sp.]|nr:DUF4294 domain-containing protein [Phnomibacter sp.]